MFSRSYGIEIECVAPVGMTRAQCAAHIAAAGVPCIEHRSHMGSSGANWVVKPDGSLMDYIRGMEVCSPPLMTKDKFSDIEKVCATLQQRGFAINRSCGLHVHVDIRRPRFDVSAMKRLALGYAEEESILDMFMPPSRRESNNTYCRSVARNISVRAIQAATNVTQIARAINGERYVKLNFNSYFKYGTVEFRHHGGTIDGTKVCMWVLACLRMVDRASKQSGDPITAASATRTINAARRGTKRAILYDMLLRPEGCTTPEVLSATGWRQVSVAGVAHQYGLEVRQQRERAADGSRTTRYWGTRPTLRFLGEPPVAPTEPSAPIVRPTTVEEFCAAHGMDEEEKQYWTARAALFASPTLGVLQPE